MGGDASIGTVSLWLKTILGVALAGLAFVALCVGLLVFLAPPAPEEPELAGRFVAGQTRFEGRERTWLVYEPSRIREPTPVVFLLPGSGQDAQALRLFTGYRFDELAERDGVLIVYAEAWAEGGSAGPEWNECRKNTPLPAHTENVDDVGFIRWLLEEVANRYEIDRTRVYAAGISDGGQMSYRLATEHPELFAAVAAVVAQQAAPENSNCRDPRGPVSVLVMNGSADPVIPYEGGIASFYGLGAAGQVQSMAGTIAHWKRVNGISGPGRAEDLPDLRPDDDSTVRREQFASASGERVVAYHIIGGGHTVPGGHVGLPDFVLGPINQDIRGADEIWKFFFPRGGASASGPRDRRIE